MKREAAAAAIALLMLTACGTDAGEVIDETAANLEQVRSGLLELRVATTSAPGEDEVAEAGFELMGSFQLPEEGGLPVADLEYTDLGADESTTQGFVSTGEQVFIEVDGQAYELPEEQTQTLVGGDGSDSRLFEGAAVNEWMVDPELSEGESLDGDEVDRVTGELDVVAALNDLFAIAQRFGASAGFTQIEGDEAERLNNAITSSHMEVVSGSEDRLLRRLLIEVDLALDEGNDLADVLGPLAGASFTVDMSISEPNRAIQVEAPADPLPWEEFPGV